MPRKITQHNLANICLLNPRDPRCQSIANVSQLLRGVGGGGAGRTPEERLATDRPILDQPIVQPITIVPPVGVTDQATRVVDSRSQVQGASAEQGERRTGEQVPPSEETGGLPVRPATAPQLRAIRRLESRTLGGEVRPPIEQVGRVPSRVAGGEIRMLGARQPPVTGTGRLTNEPPVRVNVPPPSHPRAQEAVAERPFDDVINQPFGRGEDPDISFFTHDGDQAAEAVRQQIETPQDLEQVQMGEELRSSFANVPPDREVGRLPARERVSVRVRRRVQFGEDQVQRFATADAPRVETGGLPVRERVEADIERPTPSLESAQQQRQLESFAQETRTGGEFTRSDFAAAARPTAAEREARIARIRAEQTPRNIVNRTPAQATRPTAEIRQEIPFSQRFPGFSRPLTQDEALATGLRIPTMAEGRAMAFDTRMARSSMARIGSGARSTPLQRAVPNQSFREEEMLALPASTPSAPLVAAESVRERVLQPAAASLGEGLGAEASIGIGAAAAAEDVGASALGALL